MEARTSDPSWTAVAINGSASFPTDIVAVVVMDPSGRNIALLDGKPERPPLYNLMPARRLEEQAEHENLTRLASPIPVPFTARWSALLLSSELKDTLTAHLTPGESVWPTEDALPVTALVLGNGKSAEAGFGPVARLREVRSGWASVLLRASLKAGENYARALCVGDAKGEQTGLDEIWRLAELGAYCAAPGEDFRFRLRRALVQMQRSEEIALRNTYDVLVKGSFRDVTWEDFQLRTRDLLQQWVGNVTQRKHAEVSWQAASTGQSPPADTWNQGVIAAPEGGGATDTPVPSKGGERRISHP